MLSGIQKSSLPVFQPRIVQALAFEDFRTNLLEFKKLVPSGEKIGVNVFRKPPIEFYTERRCLYMNPEKVRQCDNLPRFFIFCPWRGSDPYEMFLILREKYKFLFRSKSGYFEAFFLERRN